MPTWVKLEIEAWTVPIAMTGVHAFRPIHHGDQVWWSKASAF
jgi:hypothetical protein